MHPDFAAADFDPARLSPLLANEGVVLLRGLLAPETLAAWLPRFEAAFTAFDDLYASGQMDPGTYEQLYRFGHVNPKYIPGFIDWVTAVLAAPVLKAALGAHFGREAYLLMNNCAPRRQRYQQAEQAIFFHQDQEFMGQLSRALNVWTPLTPAGGDYPGLELWLGGPQSPVLSFSMSPAEREAIYARIPTEALWRPQLNPGDMLIFSPYTIHRTWLEPGMTQTRISSELRLISQADTALSRARILPIAF